MHDITFADLQVNGRFITDAQSGNFNIDPETTYDIAFKTSPAVPVRLEAEDMKWDNPQKVIISEEDPNEIHILEKDIKIGASIFVPIVSNELTFTVRARAVCNRRGRVTDHPKMTLFLNDKIIGEWQVESPIEQGQIQSINQDYSTALPVNKGIHQVALAMTSEPPGSDWDLIVDFLDVMTSLMEDPSVEGFESGGFNRFDWISSGDTEWIVTTDKTKSGMYSARAGSIDNDGSTTLEITLDCTSGTISFYYKVSSESGYDRLEFYVDGRQEGEWSGEEDWTEISLPIQSGRRTFQWTYSKDSSLSSGDDTAWIDDIVFPIP